MTRRNIKLLDLTIWKKFTILRVIILSVLVFAPFGGGQAGEEHGRSMMFHQVGTHD